ncbi:MAG TPA: hypothetical protein VGK94_12740 [Candidatus Polarisedimenticolia bacterium]|jgi:Flp pilus assembly pilin Flp
MRKLFGLIGANDGQEVAEYTLLISLITLVAIAGATLLGDRILTILRAVAGALGL